MVKISVKNDKLYLERAGKETQLESVTIFHHKAIGRYRQLCSLIMKSIDP